MDLEAMSTDELLNSSKALVKIMESLQFDAHTILMEVEHLRTKVEAFLHEVDRRGT